MRTVALVACAKTKRKGSWPARDLYDSPLFRLSRSYAERNSDAWYVLSALHGLVGPDELISDYERTLKGASRNERRDWASGVKDQMDAEGLLDADITILWLAGRDYQSELAPHLEGVTSLDPLQGLPLGKRLSWLSQELREQSGDTSAAPTPGVSQALSSGRNGRDYMRLLPLLSTGEPDIELSLDEIAVVIGGLPHSARVYPAWWSGERGHAVWVREGYRASPRLSAGRVVFSKRKKTSYD